MKVTKTQLKQIIKEEIETVLGESLEDEQTIWANYVTDNPLPGMSPEMSNRMFSAWLPDMVRLGHIWPPRSINDVLDAYDELLDMFDPEPEPEPEPEPQQGFSGSYQELSKKAEELYNEYKGKAAQDLLYTDQGEDMVATQESEATTYLGMLLRENANPSEQEIIDTIEKGWSDGSVEYYDQREYYGDYD